MIIQNPSVFNEAESIQTPCHLVYGINFMYSLIIYLLIHLSYIKICSVGINLVGRRSCYLLP